MTKTNEFKKHASEMLFNDTESIFQEIVHEQHLGDSLCAPCEGRMASRALFTAGGEDNE